MTLGPLDHLITWTFGPLDHCVDPWTLGSLDELLRALGPLYIWIIGSDGPLDPWIIGCTLEGPWIFGPLDHWMNR